MRIKEGDEWKAAFSMPDGAFQLIVMFLGLINSLMTFQAMMNNLLRDIIEAGDVVALIDDVMVGTETEERHNDIVKEVLRKMVENDLCVEG